MESDLKHDGLLMFTEVVNQVWSFQMKLLFVRQWCCPLLTTRNNAGLRHFCVSFYLHLTKALATNYILSVDRVCLVQKAASSTVWEASIGVAKKQQLPFVCRSVGLKLSDVKDWPHFEHTVGCDGLFSYHLPHPQPKIQVWQTFKSSQNAGSAMTWLDMLVVFVPLET